MWCLFMASGVVPSPPGGGKVFRICSPGTSLATWTTCTAGPPPGCRRMCLKLACSLWNTQPLPQAGRSTICCCIHWLVATNAYLVHQLKRVCHVLPNQCSQKQTCTCFLFCACQLVVLQHFARNLVAAVSQSFG